MLYALLLLGLLPAAFLIDGPESDEDPDDFGGAGGASEGSPSDGAVSPHGGTADPAAEELHKADPEPGAAAGAEPEPDLEIGDSDPETLEIPSDAGDAQISGFRPGIDSLNLRLDSPDTGFYMSRDSETGDGMLHIEETDGERVVTFEGLDGVPLDDISVTVTDPLSGVETVYTLNSVAGSDAASLEPMEGEEPLEPTAPDLPEAATPAAEDDPAPLEPLDPEAPSEPVPGEVPEVPLEPVDSVYDELSQARGDGDLDALLTRDSDSFGPSDAETSTPVPGTGGDDDLAVAAGGDGDVSYLAGTPVLGGTPGLVDAGDGDDTVMSAGGSYVFGGAGNDQLIDRGASSALYGGSGDDLLQAGPGGSYLDGGAGNDTILGGAGDDVIEGGAHLGDAGAESDDDVIDGGAGDDVIRGGAGADLLSGGDGNDIIDHAGRAEERVPAEVRLFDWHMDGASDHLDGGDGDDTLIFGEGDTAHGGSGADQFHLYSSAGAPAVIDDFAPGQDFLRITLDPAQYVDVPSVEVAPSEDGLDGLVRVDGVVVAVLQGTPSATVADLYVEVLPDLAA
jgi:hypothetical protein